MKTWLSVDMGPLRDDLSPEELAELSRPYDEAELVAMFIGDLGWCEPRPDEVHLVELVRIDDTVGDGEILLREDGHYYLSTKTAERRIDFPLLRVWNTNTGELMLEGQWDFEAAPYQASRPRFGLAE